MRWLTASVSDATFLVRSENAALCHDTMARRGVYPYVGREPTQRDPALLNRA
jgi:hypothetical protein